MSRYAKDTTVSSTKSRAEIEETLMRYGADRFIYGAERGVALVGFEYRQRAIRMHLPMPDAEDPDFLFTPNRGIARGASAARAAWEQACRQRWRALALVIKAKLEAIESGISTFEEEFLAWTVLPGGKTVIEDLGPKIETAIAAGKLPQLTLGG